MSTVHFRWASGPPHFFIPCNLRGLVHLSGACLACLEFSCLSRVRFSDLDQPPRGEKERRDERAIRKEGNSTHQKRNQPYPRRRKERGKNDKGKKRERRKYGKAGTEQNITTTPGEGRKKKRQRKEERRKDDDTTITEQ